MKLVSGSGSETIGACWMSGVHYYTRADRSWSDHPSCVSAVVRTLCIFLNDWCKDNEREELIGQHYFAPLGTATGLEDEVTRAQICARKAREWADHFVGSSDRRMKEEVLSLILECCAVGTKKEMVVREPAGEAWAPSAI